MGEKLKIILGKDEFLVDRRAKEIFTPWKEQTADEYSVETINGQCQKLEDVTQAINQFRDAAQTDSLFGGSKTIWLRSVNFLGDDRVGKSAGKEEADRLRELIESLRHAEHRIVISASPVDRKRSFYKWAAKQDGTEYIDDKKAGGAAFSKIIEEECKNSGCTISSDAVETLRGVLNGEIRMAVEEIRKVITALPQGITNITAQRIMEEVPEFGEAEFFEAAEKFFQGDLSQTLEAIRRHFFVKKEGRPLLSNLMNRNRLMIQAKVLFDARMIRKSGYKVDEASLQSAAQWAGDWYGNTKEKNSVNVFSQHPFYLGNLLESARRIPLRTLIDRQAIFVETFREMIQNPNETETVFRNMVVRCLGASNT